jgi:hypothetical protein
LVHDTQASFSTYAEGIYGDGTTPALFWANVSSLVMDVIFFPIYYVEWYFVQQSPYFCWQENNFILESSTVEFWNLSRVADNSVVHTSRLLFPISQGKGYLVASLTYQTEASGSAKVHIMHIHAIASFPLGVVLRCMQRSLKGCWQFITQP